VKIFILKSIFIFQIILLLSTSTSCGIKALYTESTEIFYSHVKSIEIDEFLPLTGPKPNIVAKHSMLPI
jgi:hypothetical protein